MATERARPPRSISPQPSSGRSSPHPAHRLPRRQIEEEPRKQDKVFRRYASQIERALAQSSSSRLEWPDYISFLGRLLKAIQAHPPKIDDFPHKTAVATRLAQCLNPSLPSGVHQKALELYAYLFNLVGEEVLARNLPVFLPGLSSVLTFASLTIRPTYLKLIEDSILTLGAATLRPPLKALLLSLLPGLEDETSEDFERCLNAIDKLRGAVNNSSDQALTKEHGFGDEYFWQCLFLASISSSSRRPGVLSYMTRRLPRLGPQKQSVHHDAGSGTKEEPTMTSNSMLRIAESVISPEPGLLIRCFICGLEDEQALLQRGFLDLLQSHLPLDSPVLTSRVDANDLQRLVSAATSVLIRRDMSLNRRLYSWYLGPSLAAAQADASNALDTLGQLSLARSGEASVAMEYFLAYGFKPLKLSVLAMFEESISSAASRVRPFRVCLSLMDRWEISSVLVPEVFVPAISTLIAYKAVASVDDFQEVLRSANAFFDGVESRVIWQQLVLLVRSGLSEAAEGDDRRKHDLETVYFVIQHFNVTEEDMVTFHVPLCCTLAMACLVRLERGRDCDGDTLDHELTGLGVKIINELVKLVPERGQLNTSFGGSHTFTNQMSDTEKDTALVSSICEFYQEHHGDVATMPPPFTSQQNVEIMLEYGALLFQPAVALGRATSFLEARARLLLGLIMRTPEDNIVNLEQICHMVQKGISESNISQQDSTAKILVLSRLVSLLFARSHGLLLELSLSNLTSSCCEHLWQSLVPNCPKHHVEVVRCMWHLDAASPHDTIVQSVISQSLQSDISNHNSSAAHKFIIFWTHSLSVAGAMSRTNPKWDSNLFNKTLPQAGNLLTVLGRPLLILLENLGRDDSELLHYTHKWLRPMANFNIVIDFLLTKLDMEPAEGPVSVDHGQSLEVSTQTVGNDRQISKRLYHLTLLYGVLDTSSDQKWAILNSDSSQSSSGSANGAEFLSKQGAICDICLRLLHMHLSSLNLPCGDAIDLIRTALRVLLALSSNPSPSQLTALNIEESLLKLLVQSETASDWPGIVQTKFLDTFLAYIKLNRISNPQSNVGHRRQKSSLDDNSVQGKQVTGDASDVPSHGTSHITPPPRQLLKCVQRRIASTKSDANLDEWVDFLIEILPSYGDHLFQDLLPLVECFCKRINSSFALLKQTFEDDFSTTSAVSEESLSSLLNGLEHILASAHERLVADEYVIPPSRSVDHAQGFFGNVVSGVFSSEGVKGKGNAGNSRLTIVLCIQDAIRVCFAIWSWADRGQDSSRPDIPRTASFAHVATKYRNRARRLLDRLFIAEPLECLETLMVYEGPKQSVNSDSTGAANALLHALDGSQPKRTMPVCFNALYSRTNPTVLDKGRMSSLTTDLQEIDIAAFLIEYTKSLDDDAMDEIWEDCMIFLRDVLSNPLQHRKILALLLLFLMTLAEKVGNTNFGEQRKMRKELSDLCLRLLSATFASGAVLFVHDSPSSPKPDSETLNNRDQEVDTRGSLVRSANIVDILTLILPRLHTILAETEKMNSAIASISTNVFSPIIHSKQFPANLSLSLLQLLQKVVNISSAVKIWRKDVTELFTHPRVFSCTRNIVDPNLLAILKPWASHDKNRMADMLSRIATPTTAGIMFGVGASAARLEADKKTQLQLRRIALLVLALEDDFIVPHISLLEEKLAELFSATPASSPSSSTRAEAFMALQAVMLQTTPVHLVSLWPLITAELQKAIECAIRGSKDYETYDTPSLRQACKLLDLLLLVAPDDFQTHTWLFITDTIDAVYRPSQFEPVGLVDDIAEELGMCNDMSLPKARSSTVPSRPIAQSSSRRTMLMTATLETAHMNKDEFVQSILHPFFSELSIDSFEATYSMRKPDVDSCRQSLLSDLFDDSTIVG